MERSQPFIHGVWRQSLHCIHVAILGHIYRPFDRKVGQTKYEPAYRFLLNPLFGSNKDNILPDRNKPRWSWNSLNNLEIHHVQCWTNTKPTLAFFNQTGVQTLRSSQMNHIFSYCYNHWKYNGENVIFILNRSMHNFILNRSLTLNHVVSSISN